MSDARGQRRTVLATGYAPAGHSAAFRYEAAFRQQAILAVFLIALAFVVGEGVVAIALLVAAVLLVLIVELISSAIEAVVDSVGSERHELAGGARDMGSAAVMRPLGLCLIICAGLLANRL